MITDNGTQFCNQHVDGLLDKYKVKHDRTTPYNPQTNGQAEAMNKILLGIFRRTVCENQREWHVKLFTALLAYRTSARMSIGMTPYSLVYGTEAVLPIERECSSLLTVGSSKQYRSSTYSSLAAPPPLPSFWQVALPDIEARS